MRLLSGILCDKEFFACRDRFGVKPFFYTQKNDVTVFASELKSLFEYPDVSAVLDKTGLCELFALSPARTQGVGVFKRCKRTSTGKIYDNQPSRNDNKEILVACER